MLRAARSARRRQSLLLLVLEALRDGAVERGFAARGIDWPVCERVSPARDPGPRESDELHRLALAGLEPDRIAGRNVELHSVRLCPVEGERAVRLEEVVVAPDLNRPISEVGDRDGDGLAALVEDDRTLGRHHFPG